MHVLWTPSWYPTPDNEFNGSFFKDQVEILRVAGNDVGICYLAPQSFWQWKPSKLTIASDEMLVTNSFPVVPKGVFKGDKEIVGFFARKLGIEYAKRWGAPDVVHAHSVFPGILVAQALAETWNIPYGLTEHRPSTLQSRKSSPRGFAIRSAVRSANFRLAVSDAFASELTNKYGAEFGVSNLPVPDSFLHTPLKEKSDRITKFVHVSHLAPNKRVEETIKAFAKVHREYPHTELHIIGGNPERINELERYSSEVGVAEGVEFLGKVTREALPSVLAQYDVLVLISRREAGGTVFAEAQSLGIPVIASATFGGLHMATSETGIVVPIDDPESLVRAMERFATRQADFDPHAIRRIAKAKFSPATFSQEHNRIYRAALEGFTGGLGEKN